MNFRKTFTAVALALCVSGSAVAAKPSGDYHASEVYSATRVLYNLALLTTNTDTLEVGIEPIVCWPYPVQWEEFYRAIQDEVNARIETLPKRERGRLDYTMGWYVWNASQVVFGC